MSNLEVSSSVCIFWDLHDLHSSGRSDLVDLQSIAAGVLADLVGRYAILIKAETHSYAIVVVTIIDGSEVVVLTKTASSQEFKDITPPALRWLNWADALLALAIIAGCVIRFDSSVKSGTSQLVELRLSDLRRILAEALGKLPSKADAAALVEHIILWIDEN